MAAAVKGPLGSVADSAPAISEIISGSSSRTCPHSGRNTQSARGAGIGASYSSVFDIELGPLYAETSA